MLILGLTELDLCLMGSAEAVKPASYPNIKVTSSSAQIKNKVRTMDYKSSARAQ